VITVTAIGRLGKPGELRTVGQSQVLVLSIAVDRQKRAGEANPTTDWYSAEIWGKRAEALAPHMAKGQTVAVSGRLELQTFQKSDKPTINVNDFTFAGGKPSGAATPAPAPAPKPAFKQQQATDIEALFGGDEEIPF
jgi:single-strand DNA-binding protein